MHFAPVQARYVRLYSNGNTRNNGNHYVEIMVGQEQGRPPATEPALGWAAADGSTLTLGYDEALDASSVPDPGAFAVTVNGSAVTVRSVSIDGSTVTLTLAGAVPPDAVATVDYTAPASDPLRDEAGHAAPDFADQAVRISTPHSFDAGDLTVAVNGQGRITALTGSDGVGYLAPGYTPALLKLIVADAPEAAADTAEQLLPMAVSQRFSNNTRSLTFFYAYGIRASVARSRQSGYATLELVSLTDPGNKDIRAAMWGPYEVTIGEQVADVVGVAYSRDFAIGLQAANEQTFGGAPYEFTDDTEVSAFDRSADAVDPTLGNGIGGARVSLNRYWRSAARLTTFGSVLQAYSRDYSADRMMKQAQIDKSKGERFIGGITDPTHPLYAVRRLAGSKIALFGVRRRGAEAFGLNRRQVFKREIMRVIHAVERGEGLPWTTGNGGLWAKFAEDSKERVLVFLSDTDNFDSNARHAVVRAGADTHYYWDDPGGIFEHAGLSYNPKWSGIKDDISEIHDAGLNMVNHALPGFAGYEQSLQAQPDWDDAPLERAITSRPQDLAETTRSTLVNKLWYNDYSIKIAGRDGTWKKLEESDRYGNTTARNFVEIGGELIAYDGTTNDGDDLRLDVHTRGAFETPRLQHEAGTVVRLLQDKYIYNAFYWGSPTVKELGRALADSVNDYNLDGVSIDGVESFSVGMHGDLAFNVFYKEFMDRLDSRAHHSEASRLSHYNWHFHDRWMWGEKKGQFLQTRFDFQFSNNVMFARNFLPAHLGGFYGESNGNGDFQWLGSKMAAMNAGMNIRANLYDKEEQTISRKWTEATKAGAFSDWQRARMLPWEKAYALDETKQGRQWRVWDMRLDLDYADPEDEPVADDADFGDLTNPYYLARPWAGFALRNVAGDALVTTSSKRDAGFQGDNAVDGFIGYYKPDGYKGDGQVSEWHTAADDSARWIQLTWDRPQWIRAVLLADRSHPDNNVERHTLQFSDGSTQSYNSLYDRGRYREHWFPSKETTSLKLTVDSHDGSNPGLGEIVVIAEDPDFRGHLTGNASIASGYDGDDGGKLFDGDLDSDANINLGDDWQSVIIDLGDTYWVDGLRVWRKYRADGRVYNDVEYKLAPASTAFGDNMSAQTIGGVTFPVVTVFETGSSGTPEYKETLAGRPVYFPPVYARYLKLQSNGNNWSDSNRYVEVEVYGLKNLAQGLTPTTNGTSSNIARATDGALSDDKSWTLGDGLKWAQLDLGGSQRVDSLRIWRHHENYGDNAVRRRYHDVIYQLSDDPAFSSGVTTVFNNDLDNSAGLGTGTDGEYDETPTGRIVHFAPVTARYVRLYSNDYRRGRKEKEGNGYVEIMVGQALQVQVRNRLPQLAEADPLVTPMNTATTLDLSTLATDPDNDALTYAVSDPAHGGVSLAGAVVTYTPDTGYYGADSLAYTVTDARGGSAAGTVPVTVNHPPIAQDATVTTLVNTPVSIDLLALISDPDEPDASDLERRLGSGASHGTVSFADTRRERMIYTPNADFAGEDRFTYTVHDRHDAEARGTITVRVDAPDTTAPTVTIASDASFPRKDAFAVTIEFSEAVTGLALSGIAVTKGTAADLTETVTGTTWTLTVTPEANYAGDLTVTVPEDAAADAADNGNAAASAAFAVDTKAPVLDGAAVDGTALALTYDEALDPASAPAGSAFAVRAGPSGSLATVALANTDPVTVSGTTVTLTLASAVAHGETVTVGYTAPSTNRLRDAVGNAAANLAGRAVDNETPDTAAPTVTIASGATHPTKDAFEVTLTFSEAVTGFAASEVEVTNGTAAASFTSETATVYVIEVTPAGDIDGDVTVTVPEDAAADAAANGNAAASATFAVDTKAPVLAATGGAAVHGNGADADLRRGPGRGLGAGGVGVCGAGEGRGDGQPGRGEPGRVRRGDGVGPDGDADAGGGGGRGRRRDGDLHGAGHEPGPGCAGQRGGGVHGPGGGQRDAGHDGADGDDRERRELPGEERVRGDADVLGGGDWAGAGRDHGDERQGLELQWVGDDLDGDGDAGGEL